MFIEYESRKLHHRSIGYFVILGCIAAALLLVLWYCLPRPETHRAALQMRDGCEQHIELIYQASTNYSQNFGRVPTDIGTLVAANSFGSKYDLVCPASDDVAVQVASTQEWCDLLKTGCHCSYTLTSSPKGSILIYETKCNHFMNGRYVGAVLYKNNLYWVTQSERNTMLSDLQHKD